MSKESKEKSLTEKLSDAAAEVNKTGGGDFEKLDRELRGDIQQIAMSFNEKIVELEAVNAHKENSKVRYQRELDAGNEQGMSSCLKEVRERNEQAEKLRTELAEFPVGVQELYGRKMKITALAQESHAAAEAVLRAAEGVLKACEQKVRVCYSLQGEINSLNTSVEGFVRDQKKAKEAIEDELIKTPRSSKNGFWLEDSDPFAGGSLRLYQRLKGVDGLSLPLLLNYEDKEKGPVNEEAWKKEYEKSETLQVEYGSAESYVEFKGKIVTQVLENYILRANGGGQIRRGLAAKIALSKCK